MSANQLHKNALTSRDPRGHNSSRIPNSFQSLQVMFLKICCESKYTYTFLRCVVCTLLTFRRKGIADEQLAKAEKLRVENKRIAMGDEDESFPSATKRMRSESVSTVSTISTGRSESPRPTKQPVSRHAARSTSPSNKRVKVWPEGEAHQDSPMRDVRPEITHGNSDKKRRRDSVSSYDSYSSEERDTRERSGSRNTRRRYQEHSPVGRGRQTESRSPQRGGGRRRLSDDRLVKTENRPSSFDHTEPAARMRERSPSPFSKRLALTQARNSGH